MTDSCEGCKQGKVCVGEEAILATMLWLESVMEPKENNEVRKRCYREATLMIHHHLGQGNRKKLPDCVVDLVRKTYPDDEGVYMEFKDE